MIARRIAVLTAAVSAAMACPCPGPWGGQVRVNRSNDPGMIPRRSPGFSDRHAALMHRYAARRLGEAAADDIVADTAPCYINFTKTTT